MAPNVTTLWQSRWWIDSQVCFKWGRKDFLFSRHPWRGWGGCKPQRDASWAVGTNVYECHMHNQASLKSVRSNSSIMFVSAFFFHTDARAFCGRVGSLNCMWVQFCVLSCWNIRSLEVFFVHHIYRLNYNTRDVFCKVCSACVPCPSTAEVHISTRRYECCCDISIIPFTLVFAGMSSESAFAFVDR